MLKTFQNLSKISKTLREILAQGHEISTDWYKDKKVHSGHFGYLNAAIHHTEIMDETKLIKQLVRKFNKGRANIWKYKDLILCYNKRKPSYINYKQVPFRKPLKISNTILNLTRKVNPFNKEEFEAIGLSCQFISEKF